MTKDEAIQQAIDFLDGSYEAHAVRKALQDALAEPAQTKKALWGARDIATGILISSEDKYTEEQASKIITFIDEFLEQPAQEPVAYTDEHKNFLEWDMVDLCYKAVCKKHEAVPLYTHPAPAKEWVDLTEDDLADIDVGIVEMCTDDYWTAFAYAISRALKEKNHD